MRLRPPAPRPRLQIGEASLGDEQQARDSRRLGVTPDERLRLTDGDAESGGNVDAREHWLAVEGHDVFLLRTNRNWRPLIGRP